MWVNCETFPVRGERNDFRYNSAPNVTRLVQTVLQSAHGFQAISFTMVQQPPVGQGLLIVEDSWSHSFRHTTLGKTPLDEWSARRRDFYLTTHNTHKRQTSMPPAGYEPTILASERPQTLAIDRAATEIGFILSYLNYAADTTLCNNQHELQHPCFCCPL